MRLHPAGLTRKLLIRKLNEIAFVDQKVMMPMRDGVRLATDIYRPKTNKKVNFVDVAATVAHFMGLPVLGPGKSIL